MAAEWQHIDVLNWEQMYLYKLQMYLYKLQMYLYKLQLQADCQLTVTDGSSSSTSENSSISCWCVSGSSSIWRGDCCLITDEYTVSELRELLTAVVSTTNSNGATE
jgi:hypothetical protein